MLHALIMAGGGGTRFWPRSRQKRPKRRHAALMANLANDFVVGPAMDQKLAACDLADRTSIVGEWKFKIDGMVCRLLCPLTLPSPPRRGRGNFEEV